MRFWPRLALLCLLLLAAVAPPAAATAAGPAAQASTLAPESTTLTVQLQADGDAEWTVSTRFRLNDANDTAAFERLAADFEAGNAEFVYDTAAFEQAAAAAANATGRTMRIQNVRYDHDRLTDGGVSYGRLILRFRWTNFTTQAGDRLRVGDAFNTTDGTWLPGLARDQTLVIRPPEGYAVLNSPPDVGVTNGTFRWTGPRSFEPGYLGAITYTGATPTDTTSPPPTDPDEGFPVGLFGGGAVLVVVVAAAVLFARRSDFEAGGSERSTDSGDGDTPTPGAAESDATETGAPPASEPGDLLSDEERVERLLERNDGRMKQASIVEETGWSNAKVSQLLSGMADEGRVEKLRIGRENLISLPDEDVTEIDDE